MNRTIETFTKVLWRDSNEGHWKIGLYSNYNNGHWVDNHKAAQVVPYRDFMKEAIGTNKPIILAKGIISQDQHSMICIMDLSDIPMLLEKYQEIHLISNNYGV